MSSISMWNTDEYLLDASATCLALGVYFQFKVRRYTLCAIDSRLRPHGGRLDFSRIRPSARLERRVARLSLKITLVEVLTTSLQQ